MWRGVFCIALSLPYGWMAIITLVVITFFLVFITGIPLIETAMAENSEYQEYKNTISKCIPWFSR